MTSPIRTVVVLAPGILIAATIALASAFVSEHHGGPQLLYALFFGMAFNFIATHERVGTGIQFASTTLLRFGVALLGARISAEQLRSLGPTSLTLVALGVVATIACGLVLARFLGRSRSEGLLTGGAVAICGASAALAIASVLPRTEANRRFTLLAVVGVTSLSTLAMIAYPPIAGVLALDDVATGIFLGGTIHDVAQVVGAGYMHAETTGDVATLVKLFRVALLVPVVLCISLAMRRHGSTEQGRPPLLPWFLVAFVALAAANTAGYVPAAASAALVRRLALVPRHRDRSARRQDLAAAVRATRLAADRPDGRGDGLPGAADRDRARRPALKRAPATGGPGDVQAARPITPSPGAARAGDACPPTRRETTVSANQNASHWSSRGNVCRNCHATAK